MGSLRALFDGRRRRAALHLAAALLLLAGALDPLRISAAGRARAIVIDRSASCARRLGASREAALRAGQEGLRPSDRFAVVEAAGRARLVLPLAAHGASPALPPESDASLEPMETDLAVALRAAADALGAPAPAGAEIVLVTDRRATRGGALPSLFEGVPVAAVDPPGEPAPNAALLRLSAPRRAPAGATVRVHAAVASAGGGARGRSLVLVRDGREVARTPLRETAPDRSEAFLDTTQPASGAGALRLGLDPPDAFPEDDEATLVVATAGERRVGLVGGGDAFARGLRGLAGVVLERLEPGQLAGLRDDLDLIVLVDVDRRALGAGLAAVEGALRAGTGLLYAGASRAFGRGGLEGTVLEDRLPLREDREGEPPVDLLLLVDTSGSMAGAKLRAATAAARALAEREPASTRVRAAFFAATLGAPFDVRGDDAAARFASATARGDTDETAALRAAFAHFDRAEARRRLFLVSDGLHGGGRAPLEEARACGEDLARAGVACHAFAVGADADVAFLAALTLDGRNGTLSRVDDPEHLPEAVSSVAARDGLVPGGPVAGSAEPDAPLVLPEAPPVVALARTRARDGARVLARVEGGPPLLALDASRRVAALAVAPGAEEAPAWADLPGVFGPLLSLLARAEPSRRGWIEGGDVLVEDERAGDVGALRLLLPGSVAWLWREAPHRFRGAAPGAAAGWADVQPAGPGAPSTIFLARAAPSEASPALPAGEARSLSDLPPPRGETSIRWVLGVLGAALLLAAWALRPEPRRA